MITAIANARIFDGERILPDSPVVLIKDEMIAALASRVPSDARVIDGSGATLLPGLIDSHVHTSFDGLRTDLNFGVTTAIEMGAERSKSDRKKIARSNDMADLRSAGVPISARCGHPNELMFQNKAAASSVLSGCHEHTQIFPTPSTPAEAIEFVKKRIDEGSDFIKLLVEDGAVLASPGLPLPSRSVLTAAINEAHRQAKMVVAHALTLAATAEVVELGVDGLAHIFLDRPHTPEIIDAIARSRVFVIPCLVLNRSVMGCNAGALAADPRVTQRLTSDWVQTLESSYNTYPQGSFEDVLATVAVLNKSGVPLLVGTDTAEPNPRMGGTAQGASVHHELQLLVEAGLTPLAALSAATSVPANIFGLADRGRIAPGTRADLLLIDGDPTTDMSNTLSLRSVWRSGVQSDGH